MLVRFESNAAASIVMFENDARAMMRMMGHSGTVPGAIDAEGVPLALERLRAAVAERSEAEGSDAATDADAPVRARTRAFPLIRMLEAARAQEQPIAWFAV